MAHALFLAMIVAIGLVVRAVPVLGTASPLNDGGLFVAMAEDIRKAGFGLPDTTSYNRDNLPFAYPPLGLYLLAALTELTCTPAVQWVRLVPLVFATASILLVYPLADRLLGSRVIALIATMAFTLLPRSYEWLVVGGGITRAPGFFLALAAVNLATAAIDRRARWRPWALASGVVLGLGALTHPEAAMFGALSIVALVLAVERTRHGAAVVAVVAALSITVVAPWVFTVVSRHGIEPLLAARESRDLGRALLRLTSLDFTGAPFLPILGILGAAGFVFETIHGRYFLPAWIVATFLITPAAAPTFVMLPWAMLVAAVVAYMPRPRQLRNMVAAGMVLIAAILSAYLTPLSVNSPLHALSDDERTAMAWVQDHTPDDARFLVVAGIRWEADVSSEWFPVLAERHSVATPQGYEWTTSAQWADRYALHDAAARCAFDGPECLDQQIAAADVDFVYIPKGQRAGPLSRPDCCGGLRAALRDDPDYQVVYDGRGATVLLASHN